MQGHTEAWFHVGVMHLKGWGTPRSLQQAQYYFSMAAKVRGDNGMGGSYVVQG